MKLRPLSLKRSSRIPASFLPNNTVKLIRGGKDYFDVLEQMITEAQQSIHLQIYIFDEDETGKRMAKALIEAANRKVNVYMVLDGYASQSLSKEFVEAFRAAGIYFRWFEPLLKSKHFYFGRRMHHKVVVADGYRCMVGGLNISNRYNDMPDDPAWLDWALYAEGEVAAVLERVCRSRIRIRKIRKGAVTPVQHEVLHGEAEENNCLVRVRINDWVSAKRQVYNSYLEMFRTASSHIIIMSPYFLPGNEFRRKMKAAIKRGVKIQVVLTGISDVAFSKYAERFMYRWLLKNHIEIYEYQKSVLHGKIAVCDGQWITVGSYNVNDLSAHASVELNLDVNNKTFAIQVEDQLRAIIKNDSECITEEVYNKHTSLVTRVMQRSAYNIFRFMLFLFTFYFRQKE